MESARAGSLEGDDAKRVDFTAEAELGVTVEPAPADPANWRRPAHIFLTGATGFLGIYLLRELLTTTDATVHCLVRADDTAHARARLTANARHYLQGDLGSTGTGSSPSPATWPRPDSA